MKGVTSLSHAHLHFTLFTDNKKDSRSAKERRNSGSLIIGGLYGVMMMLHPTDHPLGPFGPSVCTCR